MTKKKSDKKSVKFDLRLTPREKKRLYARAKLYRYESVSKFILDAIEKFCPPISWE